MGVRDAKQRPPLSLPWLTMWILWVRCSAGTLARHGSLGGWYLVRCFVVECSVEARSIRMREPRGILPRFAVEAVPGCLSSTSRMCTYCSPHDTRPKTSAFAFSLPYPPAKIDLGRGRGNPDSHGRWNTVLSILGRREISSHKHDYEDGTTPERE